MEIRKILEMAKEKGQIRGEKSVDEMIEEMRKIPFEEAVRVYIDEFMKGMSIAMLMQAGPEMIKAYVDAAVMSITQHHNLVVEPIRKENENLRDIINNMGGDEK